jgi:hypothetical protein
MIEENLQKYKIHQLQLDPYGVCNAKCWFCPVRYEGNPAEGKEVMSIELLEKIIKNFIEERDKEDGLVHKDFSCFYTGHYNEVLLYPHFENLLEICEKYGVSFMLLSNGITLTPENVDIMLKHRRAINSIHLNIPAFEPEIWSKRTGVNIKQFDKMISNVKYAMKKFPELVSNHAFSLQINGSDLTSFNGNGGFLDKGPDFPADIDLDPINGELATQERLANELFNGLKIFKVKSLIDRAGLLDNIMTNKNAIKNTLMKGDPDKKVIGCLNGKFSEDKAGRDYGWVHVNSAGKVFICCNDYNMEIKFGDFKNQTLSDFWGKADHIEKIQSAYNTICRNCTNAIFEN